jgi:hypothetical protein
MQPAHAGDRLSAVSPQRLPCRSQTGHTLQHGLVLRTADDGNFCAEVQYKVNRLASEMRDDVLERTGPGNLDSGDVDDVD